MNDPGLDRGPAIESNRTVSMVTTPPFSQKIVAPRDTVELLLSRVMAWTSTLAKYKVPSLTRKSTAIKETQD